MKIVLEYKFVWPDGVGMLTTAQKTLRTEVVRLKPSC